MNKQEIRKHYFSLRKLLDAKDVETRSTNICHNFIENLLPLFNMHNNIFSLYFSAYNEVYTDLIAKYFINHDVTFCYPKIVAKDSALEFVIFSQHKKIVASAFYKGIKEVEGNELVNPNILIIPLISFDSNKMRLGMGGGFFDRTIGKHSNITTVALAYDFQLFDTYLPKEKYDKSVDYIVTETRIFS